MPTFSLLTPASKHATQFCWKYSNGATHSDVMYKGYATSQYLGLETISLAFGTIVLMAFAHWGSLTSACMVCAIENECCSPVKSQERTFPVGWRISTRVSAKTDLNRDPWAFSKDLERDSRNSALSSNVSGGQT